MLNNVPLQSSYVRLLAAESTKIFLPAIAGARIHLVSMNLTSITSAAQEIRIRLTGALTEIYRIGASLPIGTYNTMTNYTLPVGEGLQADPAAAGPSIGFYVSYQVIPWVSCIWRRLV